MKILIVPMVAMAETSGPSSRCRLLAEGFRSEGFDVATCMAKDVNYKVMNGIDSAEDRETKSLISFAEKIEEKHRLIIVTNEEERTITKDGVTIEVIPAYKFILDKK